MKNIFKHICLAVLTLAAFAACAPEEIVHPTEAGIARATSVEPVIYVDQETNLVTFSIPAGTQAVIPVGSSRTRRASGASIPPATGSRRPTPPPATMP